MTAATKDLLALLRVPWTLSIYVSLRCLVCEGRDWAIQEAKKPSTIVQLVMHAEATSWNRFYNYLMAITFLMMAWATLYVSAKDSVMITVILTSICAIGFLMGLFWAGLGYRGRRFLFEYTAKAERMEKDPAAWDPQLSYGPITLSNHLRDTMPFKKAGSLYLLIGVPLLFATLYFVLIIASLIR